MPYCTFKKRDDAKRIVMGEVLVPDVVDKQDDVMTAAEIEKAAHGYLAGVHKGTAYVGRQHIEKADEDTVIVESFIARPGDPDFPEGSWVMAVRCSESDWECVEKGEITGFSVGGKGYREEVS
jgi:hypothetical protein